jgi:(4S)-4-hydroxy-5-phosphonooxypentane-2,3-dione isomerase
MRRNTVKVLLVTIQIKPEFRDNFIESMLGDAIGSVEDEPGCLRFDVIQDEADANKIYLYEVYKDDAAFQAHTQAPHYTKWRDTVKDWFAAPTAVSRGSNLFPPDARWQPQP